MVYSPTVVSDKQIKSLRGKLKSLKVLTKNPRAESAEIRPFIVYLTRTIHEIIDSKSLPRTEENLKMVQKKLSDMPKLEDLLIRVIVGGESLQEARERNRRK
uniref:DUF2200 family protein n=1 Tax=Caenorhabditis tropicalis TaxID=1561998 RepID=A0A1I7TGT2_9PELO